MSTQVDQGKHQVTDLAFQTLVIVEVRFEFRQLLVQLADHAIHIGPIETYAGSAASELASAHQRREASSDPGQMAGVALPGLPFLGLEPFPRRRLRVGVLDLLVTKHMRMAPDHLATDAFDDIGEPECADLLGHARVIDHLQQEIAQLVAEILQLPRSMASATS